MGRPIVIVLIIFIIIIILPPNFGRRKQKKYATYFILNLGWYIGHYWSEMQKRTLRNRNPFLYGVICPKPKNLVIANPPKP